MRKKILALTLFVILPVISFVILRTENMPTQSVRTKAIDSANSTLAEAA